MFTSIASVSISGRLDAKLRAIADAGFDGVELVENDLLAYDGTARDVGLMIRDLGLTCTAFQRVDDFEGMSGAVRAHNFNLIERKLDTMEQVGADLLIVGSNASHGHVRRSSTHRRGFPRAGRASARAWHAYWLRGAGLGPIYLRSPRSLVGRERNQPSGIGAGAW